MQMDLMLKKSDLAERVIIKDFSWYVPHSTSNGSHQKLLLDHIVSRAAKF